MKPAKAQTLSPRLRLIFGLAGLAAAALTYGLMPADPHPEAPAMAAIVVWMATWWIFEIIPIPATSLLPIVLMPLFGIATVGETTAFYGKSTVFLFLGGFILALGLQESNVHKRIALAILNFVGSKPARLVLGFMVATSFMSMWISNTATVIVMLPIALSVLEQAKTDGVSDRSMRNFALSLMLGIAYSADMGGMATFVGTAPNLVYRDVLTELFPGAPEPGFVNWMMMGLPLAVLFVTTGWLLLTRLIFPVKVDDIMGGKEIIRENLKALGRMRQDEVLSLLVFGLAAVLWITGGDIVFGEEKAFLGWHGRLGIAKGGDALVAIACALLLFVIPSGDRKGETLMRWESALKVPWGILLLFGGGFALAGGFGASGLSAMVGNLFAQMAFDSPVLLVILVCLILTFMTEVTSNTATTTLVMPILANAAVILNVDPRVLMIPATLSASCAFMMPVASPTQAIVFSSGYVSIRQMIFAGIWFNLLGIVLVTAIFLALGGLVWGIDFGALPAWAGPQP